MHTGRSQKKHLSLVFLSSERGQKLHLFPDAIDDDDAVDRIMLISKIVHF